MFNNVRSNWYYKTGITFFLFASILAVYWQVGGHDFLLYDDPEYITENPYIQHGLTIDSIKWAFTSFHACNWHPLTWLSHIVDVELFGMNPTGHHFVNIALHFLNSTLLFLLLNRYTDFLWRSAAVAVLFALHPLHVESVAWAAERKDVLSALFWLLTLYLYAKYVKRPGLLPYTLVLTSFAMGLLAKPMLVTLPFVMLLLDYWPLRRFESTFKDSIKRVNNKLAIIFIDKIPFILLTVASSTITIYAQKAVISSVSTTSITSRIFNALAAYQSYLFKTILPLDLTIFYPFNHELPILQILCATVLLLTVTTIAVRQRQAKPYFFVGWFWYLLTLIPVIGIVQVGLQSMADRYTYIPLIGIFLLIVWGIDEITKELLYRRTVLTILTMATILACSVTTWRQVSYWKNNTTLFTHALNSTQNNFIAHFLLGCDLEKKGQLNEAIVSYKATLKVNPFYGAAYAKLGKISYEAGNLDDAIDYYYKELFVSPLSVNCRNNLGIALAEKGKFDEAIGHFTHALTLEPGYVQVQNNLKHALEMKNAGN
jgi:tetratricopeptide (TPR) repeat protein